MIDDGPSRTALQVAAARAAHLRFDSPPHLLEDPLAQDLLGPENAEMIEGYGDDGPWVLKENRIFIPLRARYAEDRLRRAYAKGIRQFVILGAGLDSFAFRQPAELSGLRVFEIDHPSMQRWKRDRLGALGWSLPSNVFYAPCDFEVQSLTDVLEKAGFNPVEPAVVSWMGVVYYLEKETVESSLRELARFLAVGSEVVFDMMRPWDELPDRYAQLRNQMAEYLSKAGEPQINRYRAEEIAGVIRDAGFTSALIESRDEIAARYLAPHPIQVPLSERFRLVVAQLHPTPETSPTQP